MKFKQLFLALLFFPVVIFAQGRAPIIDMHMHALGAADQGPPPMAMCTPIADFPAWDPGKSSYGEVFMGIFKNPPCKNPVWSPKTDEALQNETLAAMKKLNVIGVLSGTVDKVAIWRKSAPERFIPALAFQLGEDKISPEDLRKLNKEGQLAVFGEITNQYAGIAPDDPRMEPYWTIAEELDVPVGIHIGTGPPGVIYLGNKDYRARLHSALTIEEVLVKHPKLRVYIMHAGYPKLDDMLAVLYAHPQVYVDVGVIVYTQPPTAFYAYLKAIVDAGFSKRVMFGSDQMVWPGVIERSIKVIEKAPFLSAAQKRDILYNNAARFLRLTPAEISRHHRLK